MLLMAVICMCCSGHALRILRVLNESIFMFVLKVSPLMITMKKWNIGSAYS